MKWVLLIVAIVLGVWGYKYFVADMTTPKPTTVNGAAGAFVRAALAGKTGDIEAISEPSARDHNIEMGDELRQVMPSDMALAWKKTTPGVGEDAVMADISGKEKLLLIEVKKSGNEYRVCRVELASQ